MAGDEEGKRRGWGNSFPLDIRIDLGTEIGHQDTPRNGKLCFSAMFCFESWKARRSPRFHARGDPPMIETRSFGSRGKEDKRGNSSFLGKQGNTFKREMHLTSLIPLFSSFMAGVAETGEKRH